MKAKFTVFRKSDKGIMLQKSSHNEREYQKLCSQMRFLKEEYYCEIIKEGYAGRSTTVRQKKYRNYKHFSKRIA